MDVVTFGETMVVLTPTTNGSMRYAPTFSAKVGGAESNVAIGLARLGHQSGWFSRLGQDEFGEKVRSFIRGEGVDVSKVIMDDSAPTGLYFKEVISEDNIHVQYYRKNSAASQLNAQDIQEAYIANSKFLHITGITPALSESCREAVLTAIQCANKHGVTVVFDPNLRRKLWEDELARKVLLELSSKADIVLPGLDEGAFLFGETQPEKLAQLFLELGSAQVVIKLGENGAYYSTKTESGFVDAFPVKRVIDPVGAGDGFAAGFLSGLLDSLSMEEAVRRGAAVGAIVTQVPGDMEGLPDRRRLQALMSVQGTGDVDR